jgi:hypothetical protein
VIVHDRRKVIGELRWQPMGQQFRHGREDLNIGAVRSHVVHPPLHVPRARIDFAEWFAVDHESRSAGFVHLQRRPETMTCGQIGQGIRHDMCMDIDYGQSESSPGSGESYYKKYRYKSKNIIFVDVFCFC